MAAVQRRLKPITSFDPPVEVEVEAGEYDDSGIGPHRGRGRPPGHPLRRGDACLMCRAKKLKCSGKKPVCDKCSKHKDKCIYDAMRSASRVEQLERKLAEIEEAELRAALAHRQSIHAAAVNLSLSYDSLTSIPFVPTAAPPIVSPIVDYSMMKFDNVNGSTGQSATPSATMATSTNSGSNSPDRRHSVASANNNVSQSPWLWVMEPEMNGYDHVQPVSSIHMQAPHWSLLSSSNDMSIGMGTCPWNAESAMENMLPTSTPIISVQDAELHAPQLDTSHLDFINLDPAQTLYATPTSMGTDSSHSHLASPAPVPPQAAAAVDAIVDHAESFHILTLDEKDISQSARDYLLELFFCPPRSRFGSEVWSESQFRAKMTLAPKQRYHPCLLFAIYTIAASGSYIPAVRALADSLYDIACAKIDESVSGEDRLLDAINASKMLGKWLFSRTRAIEGYQMTWKSVSLAMACQLHRIPSSVFSQGITDKTMAGNKEPWPLLGPPKDQWDLCERIHAFWSVWANEHGAAIMLPWATAIRDEEITTPLPRHPDDYLDGAILCVPDITLRDLYALPKGRELGFEEAFCCSIHIMTRAKRIQQMPPEARPTFRALQSRGPKRPIRKEYPAAYEEIMAAIDESFAAFPESIRVSFNPTASWTSPEAPFIHMALVAAKMMLHDVEHDEYDRTQCLAAAHDLVKLFRPWMVQLKLEAERDASKSVRTANRHAKGLGGPYTLVPWFWTADKLTRGSHVLATIGREKEARACADEASIIIKALKSLGVLYHLGSSRDVFQNFGIANQVLR